jgi:hypothetical protein
VALLNRTARPLLGQLRKTGAQVARCSWTASPIGMLLVAIAQGSNRRTALSFWVWIRRIRPAPYGVLGPRVLNACQVLMPSDVCLSFVFEAALQLSSVHVYSARRRHSKSCSAVSQFPILNNLPVSTCRFVAFRRPSPSKAVPAVISERTSTTCLVAWYQPPKGVQILPPRS